MQEVKDLLLAARGEVFVDLRALLVTALQSHTLQRRRDDSLHVIVRLVEILYARVRDCAVAGCVADDHLVILVLVPHNVVNYEVDIDAGILLIPSRFNVLFRTSKRS